MKSEGVQTRLPVGTSLMVGGLLGSPADGVGLHTSFWRAAGGSGRICGVPSGVLLMF